MRKVAIDYKGKHFTIYDEDLVDDIDFVDMTRNVDFVIENNGALINHVEDCLYYGIPSYVGSDADLKKKIEAIESRMT